MIKDLFKWKPIIIGVIMMIAFYAVSSIISGLNITLPAFLLVAIFVGFMVGGQIKDGAINGTIFGLLAGVVISLFMVITYVVEGYGAYLGFVLNSLLVFFVLEIIIAAAGGLLGALVRRESEKETITVDTPLE